MVVSHRTKKDILLGCPDSTFRFSVKYNQEYYNTGSFYRKHKIFDKVVKENQEQRFSVK